MYKLGEMEPATPTTCAKRTLRDTAYSVVEPVHGLENVTRIVRRAAIDARFRQEDSEWVPRSNRLTRRGNPL